MVVINKSADNAQTSVGIALLGEEQIGCEVPVKFDLARTTRIPFPAFEALQTMLSVPFPCGPVRIDPEVIFHHAMRQRFTFESIGNRHGRSAHIAVFGNLLVELPQLHRAAPNRYDLIEIDIGLLPARGCRRYEAIHGRP